ncbi:MAG: hypothetical protein ACRC9R_10575 [Enterovibrio sp.]
MAKFLIEIGRQHASLPQTVAIELEDHQKMVQIALQLGDIIEVGVVKPSAGQKMANAMCACARTRDYPIYQFVCLKGEEALKFTLAPGIVERAHSAVPPRISHIPGQVHSSMLAALWGGYRYTHPELEDAHGDFEDLIRGMRLRYSGQP